MTPSRFGHPRRLVRLGIVLECGAALSGIVLTWTVLNMHPRSAQPWVDFSIRPAIGTSFGITPTSIRSSGITPMALVAFAYDIPSVRVFGPDWLSSTRYGIDAVVDLDDAATFRQMLRRELEQRIRLETHTEMRPFEVFVLSAGDAPRLQRAEGRNPRTSLEAREVRLRDASMDRLATVLQHVLGRPVIDETGITDVFDLDVAWDQDRVGSVSRRLAEVGLRLTPETRNLEALVVDRARPDAALLLIAQVGRLAQLAPAPVRQPISKIFNVR